MVSWAGGPKFPPSQSDGSWRHAQSVLSLRFCSSQPCSQCLRVLNGLVRRHSPRWGDYDDTHTWRDAAWWWENRPEWVRAHHPDWWGDFDDTHYWRPGLVVLT